MAEEELQDLLQQLDDGPPKEAQNKKTVEVNVENIKNIGAPSTAAVATLTDMASPNSQVDVHKYLSKLDDVTDEILAACRSDRQEAQDVIHLLRDQIELSLGKSQMPSRMYVDGLVAAVEVKANINMTAVKIIEANAKMLAATKATANNVLVNQNVSVGNNDSDLVKILDEPLTKMDEI